MATKITRLNRESDPPAGKPASATPQYWDRETEDVEDVEGLKGAPFSMLVGPDGEPIDDGNPLEARVRLLETLIGPLNASKETNPDASSAALLALVRGQLASISALKTEVDKLTALIDNSRLKTEATLSGSIVLITAARGITVAAGAAWTSDWFDIDTYPVTWLSCNAASTISHDWSLGVEFGRRGTVSGASTTVGGRIMADVDGALLGATDKITCRGARYRARLENRSSSERTYDLDMVGGI